MADEVTYGTARAADTDDTQELSKEALQRRMEEARESISQTVAEIKDTVVNQYQSVKDTVSETLDWREQYRKRPLAWSLGALGAGFILGYSLGGVFVGDDEDEDEDYERGALSPEDTRVFDLPPARMESSSSYAAPRSYAAQAITGGSYGASSYAAATGEGGAGSETAAAHYGAQQSSSSSAAQGADYAYSGGRSAGETSALETAQPQQQEDEEPQGPSLIERFKGTKAYDRLQEEVASLGDRFIDELSRTAQTVVLPALFSKVKDLFGVDLSGKHQSGGNGGSGASGAGGGSATASGAGAAGGSSSYATSENRPYGGGQGGQS